MNSSDESVSSDTINVLFEVGNVPSRYASNMRPSSPALSEASSCTLVEGTPEVVPNPNSVVTNSTAPDTQAPFSPLPASSTAPTQKRPRERSHSNELLWTDRENFNSAKRRIGVSGAVSSNVNAALISTTRFPTFSPTAVPNQENQENQEILSSLRGHPIQAKIDSLVLPLRVSTPRANKHPLRQTSPLISQDIIELDDEEALPLFKLPDGAELINLEDYDGEDALEEEILGIGPEILNKDNIKRPSLARRNPDILPPDVEISSIPWKSSVLRLGKTVEISDGSFIKIKSLIKDITNDEVFIRGWKLVRTRDFVLGGIVRKKRNEVAFLHEIDRDDGRDVWEQSVHAIRPEEVTRIRRLVCTNRPFPECRYQKEDIPSEIKMKEEKEAMRYVEDEMVLVARWVLVARFSNAETRVRTASVLDRPRNSVILRSLREDECTEGDYADSHIKKLLWRGETVLGGSGNLNSGSSSSRYTYGDGYCGAGGMSVGAAAAGLKVKWGFDFNHHAGNTWQKNFPRASFHFLPVNEFAALPDPNQDLWVDILHLSPPCQVFSPVHTVPGQNDDMNYASLFGVRCTIEKTRPRIVTLEQTFGILHPKNKDAFNGLISCFTDFGFDVSWQVVKFQGYGTPSRRTRLIILASCPGEPLPHMPQYTHTDPLLRNPSQKSYYTPNEALSSIPHNAANHDPHFPALYRSNHTPWDGSVICGCIMTGGGIGLGLPNGSRGMTNRELAALQSFPLTHVFHGQEIRKQVGNAVPPAFAKVLMGSVRRQLERRDGWGRNEVVVLSDDE